jgi:hypothetical protein
MIYFLIQAAHVKIRKMEGTSVLISAAVGDNNHEAGGAEDALVEYNKSHQKIHNPFRLYDNFRKGCTNVLTAQRGLKGSNGFRNNGGHPNHHHSQCYDVADAQSSLASSSIQITSIKPRRLNSEADSSDSSNSADDTTQIINIKSPKHRSSDSSNFSSSNEDNSYPQPIGDFSKEIFSSLDSTLGSHDDSLIISTSSNNVQVKATGTNDHSKENENQCKRRNTTNDGNTTDDSGVDSICCTLDTGDKLGGSKNNNEDSQVNRDNEPSNASPSLRGAQNSKSASSFLQDIATYGYDTISKKRNSIWKREYNINGAGGNNENHVTSVQEECKDLDTKEYHTYANVDFSRRNNSYSLVAQDKSCNVELTSVVQNKSLINVSHNVTLPHSEPNSVVENDTKFNITKRNTKIVSTPIYSSVNVETKKASKKKGKDSSVCRQISNAAFSKLPVLKFMAEDIDIGEKSYTPDNGNESSANHHSSGRSQSTTIGPQETEVTDLRELTKLLNNTSALLQRNSNLRASLTISVKNPRNGASNAKTFVLPSGRDSKDSAKSTPLDSPNTRGNSDAKSISTNAKEVNTFSRTNSNFTVRNEGETSTPFSEFTYTEVPIDCDFKNSSGHQSKIANSKYFVSDNDEKKRSDKEEVEEDQFVSLVNIDGDVDPSRPPAFVRHNPIRRPVVGSNMTTTSTTSTSSSGQHSVTSVPTVCRRSIRLAPKTVANLANKFEGCGLLEGKKPTKGSNVKEFSSNASKSKPSVTTNKNSITSSQIPEKELKLCKKDITKIIGTLNRMEEDAKRSCYRPLPMTTPGSTLKKNIGSKKDVSNTSCENSIATKCKY